MTVFFSIIRDHAGWSFTGNRKQKNFVKFLAIKWSQSLKISDKRVFETVFDWETKRLFVKWSLTGGGRLREVVATRECSTYLSLKHCSAKLNKFHGKLVVTDWAREFVDVFELTCNRVEQTAERAKKGQNTWCPASLNNWWMRLSILWRIMEIEEGVIRRSRRLRRITPSEICIILLIIWLSLFSPCDWSICGP